MHDSYTSSSALLDGLRPVVILGAARSGTKFLRRLLGASRVVAVIPYGVNDVWRRDNEHHDDDALPLVAATPAVRQRIRSALAHLARRGASKDACMLVEKTSANTLRVPFVNAVLPEARYIHIVRDGCDVTESAYRRWTAPPEPSYLIRRLTYLLTTPRSLSRSTARTAWHHTKKYVHKAARLLTESPQNSARGGNSNTPVWGPRYPGIEQDTHEHPTLAVCARQWRACIEATERGLDHLFDEKERKTRLLSLRYEQLVHDPGVVDDLCAFADLPDPETVRAYYRAHVHAGSVGRGRRAFGAAALDTVRPILDPTLARLEYRPVPIVPA